MITGTHCIRHVFRSNIAVHVVHATRFDKDEKWYRFSTILASFYGLSRISLGKNRLARHHFRKIVRCFELFCSEKTSSRWWIRIVWVADIRIPRIIPSDSSNLFRVKSLALGESFFRDGCYTRGMRLWSLLLSNRELWAFSGLNRLTDRVRVRWQRRTSFGRQLFLRYIR